MHHMQEEHVAPIEPSFVAGPVDAAADSLHSLSWNISFQTYSHLPSYSMNL